MTIRPKDPLLAIARVLTWFFIIVLGFVGAAMLVATPFVAFNNATVVAELVKEGVQVGSEVTFVIVMVLLAVAGLMALAIWFLRLLLRIIDSVGEGDPFAPINAVRLNRMAWISLGAYVATLPVGAMVMWLASVAKEAHADVSTDFDLGGSLLMPLVLFILARVFRLGAAMREDLEGTV
ncbi:DUF2975 domain-containing protein [Tsuneonella sp. HG249]